MKSHKAIIYSALIFFGIILGGFSPTAKKIVTKTIERLVPEYIYSINQSKFDNKLDNIIQMIDQHYVDSLNYEEFENKIFNSILTELDPHSSYISKKDFKTIKQDMQGSFSGIGVEFKIIEDSIAVVSPISGGPSEKLGIMSGDRIVLIEGKDVAGKGITNEEVINKLRGKKGVPVNITIKRKGKNNLIPFKIIRDDIPLYSVDAGIMLNKDIGYIKINRFAEPTYMEMMQKSEQLVKQGMKKLILDLRNNPGGYLHIANEICDEFLQDGELIVFTKGRNRPKKEIFATKKGSLEKTDIIILINEGSASASEIVAGALQDNDRGLIIGKRSFGKGLVQEQVTLNDGSIMRLTTQRYYTPSGRCIQKDYGTNNKDYYLEKYHRNDTITDNIDNLKYKTLKKGRPVYGGGGINPDIIIETESNVNYQQINYIISKGWVNDFCLEKSEALDVNKVNHYEQINKSNIYNNFLTFLKEKEKKLNLKLGRIELNYLQNLLIANIARNLWGNDMYYKALSQEDEYVQKAIRCFKEE